MEESGDSPTQGEFLIPTEPVPVSPEPNRAEPPIDHPGPQANIANPSGHAGGMDEVETKVPAPVAGDGARGKPASGLLATDAVDQGAEPEDSPKAPETALNPDASLAPAPNTSPLIPLLLIRLPLTSLP
jgi:hypothetical protein